MFGKLLLLFTLVPALELYLLITIGAKIGVLTTIAVIVFTGVLGAALARQEGLRTLQKAQASLNTGQMPTDAMVEGLMILFAGGLLLTPGFLTDAFGFSLLIPPIRALVRETLKKRFKQQVVVQTFGTPPQGFGFGTENPFESQPGPDVPPEQATRPSGSVKPDIIVQAREVKPDDDRNE